VKLAAKAAWVDFRNGSQGKDAAHTNMHAMRGEKQDGTTQTPAEARAGTSQVVSDAMKTGDTGLAVHAVEDLATPLHDGHVWNGVDGSFVKHVIGDIFPSTETVKNAFDNAVQVLQGQPQGPQAPGDSSCGTTSSTQILCSQDSGGQVLPLKNNDHGPN
jgi:hypothetical protein